MRRVTLGWVVFPLPVLTFTFGMLIVGLPRMLATAWDSFFVQLDKITSGSGLDIAVGVIQILALVLPLAGLTYTFVRVGSKIASGTWNWSKGAPLRRAAVLAVTVARCRRRRLGRAPERRLPADPGDRARNGPGRDRAVLGGQHRPARPDRRARGRARRRARRARRAVREQPEEQPAQTATTTTTGHADLADVHDSETADRACLAGVTATVETPTTTVSETVTTETTEP